MKPTDHELAALLSFDPLAQAERETGGSYKTDPLTLALGVGKHLGYVEQKRAALLAVDDTLVSNPLNRYQRIIGEEGFTLALDLPFVGPDAADEHLFVCFHPDGLLLVFDTYNGDHVNSGKVYYNWAPTHPDNRREWGQAISSGSMCDGVWAGDHDCREAIRFKLRRLRALGSFVSPWQRQSFLWLLHYMDTKTKGYDYKAITAVRIALLPAAVQAAIAPPSTEKDQA